jgi:tol-pal system protein YbgF
LTLSEAAPYPLLVIRPISAIACLVLSGCATDVVSRSEHAELLSSVRALRAENARLEQRLEKLESQQVISAARVAQQKPAVVAASSKPAPSSVDAMPPLAVVKLKPKREAAPRIDTAVEVAEPPEALTQEFQNEAAPPAAEEGPSPADTQFERALSMMKTGNSEGGVAGMVQFVADWPRHPKADNALYFTGMAYVADRDFARATEFFERVVSQYPAGDAVIDSMLRLADCRVRLNKPREARATWEKIVTTFPGTAAATQAQARLASSTQTPVASP